MQARATLQVEGYFDPATGTLSYIVLDTSTRHCALIDSVRDYDPKSGRTAHSGADRLIARVRALDASVQWILETHVHADHLSDAPYLQQQLGGRLGIGEHITAVHAAFCTLFNDSASFPSDGRHFDHLFTDGEIFSIGSLRARALHTPGHTPACMTYAVSDDFEAVAFVGDTLFMPDCGTARCDFPGGDARMLFRSISKLLGMQPTTQLYMCHDYPPEGRDVQFISSVGEQLETNIHVRQGISEADFVSMRLARDATLEMPALILPAVQVNLRGGALPEPEANGVRYIKIPIDAF